jgi:hypothetical protein
MPAHLIAILSALIPLPRGPGGWACPWLCSADGPSTPFGSVGLSIADSFRLICFALGLVSLSYIPAGLFYAGGRGHRMRFYALAAFILVAVTTEAEHMGDTPSYRLVLNVVGCFAAVYGLITYSNQAARTDKT